MLFAVVYVFHPATYVCMYVLQLLLVSNTYASPPVRSRGDIAQQVPCPMAILFELQTCAHDN